MATSVYHWVMLLLWVTVALAEERCFFPMSCDEKPTWMEAQNNTIELILKRRFEDKYRHLEEGIRNLTEETKKIQEMVEASLKQRTTTVPTTALTTKKEETSVARSPRPSSIATPTEPQTNHATTLSPTTKFEDSTAVSSTVLSTAEEETTMPPTTESQDTTAEPMTTQMTTPKPCEKYSSNATCKFVYEEKCFNYKIAEGRNVDLEAARQMCTNMGFELGNITEECVFEELKKHAEANQEVFGDSNLWTGMSVTAENINDYGSTGEKNAWWYEGIPTEENPIYIRFKKSFIRPFKMGLMNAPATTHLIGAFCEKPR